MNTNLERLLLNDIETYEQKIAEARADLAMVRGMNEEDDGLAPIHASAFLAESGAFEWLVGGIFAEGTISIVAAESTAGKTTLLVQMGLQLSMGQDWLGWRSPRHIRVLYILAEGSRHAFRGRFRTTCASLGLDPSTSNLFFHAEAMRDFNLKGREFASVVRRSKADLIVLDTKGYFDGFADENDASAWKKGVMAPLRRLVADLGCSFIIVHHYGKAAPGKARWERGRGTSAMFADVDHWLGLEKIPLTPSEEQLLSFQKAQLLCRRDLFIEKNKYGRDDYSVRLDFGLAKGIFTLGAPA